MLKSSWTALWLLLLGLLLPLGCKSKGPAMPSLTINSVSPSGIVGLPGQSVQFSADLSNASGNQTYEWDFGGGGTPDDPTSATPTVSLLGVDEYNGFLRVVDGGDSTMFPFDFEVVGVPTVTSVAPDGIAGLPGEEVEFSAEAEYFVTGWRWTFELPSGPAFSVAANPVLRLPQPGTYSGTVVASNSVGDSEPFPFEFEVVGEVIPQWTSHDLRMTSIGSSFAALTEHEGRLAVLFRGSDNRLWFGRAQAVRTTSAAQWEFYQLDPEGRGRGPQSLISRGGRLIAAYGAVVPDTMVPQDFDGVLRVAVSNIAEPTEPAHWTFMDLDGIGQHQAETGTVALLDLPEAGGLYLAFGNGPRITITDSEPPQNAHDWTTTLVFIPGEARFVDGLSLVASEDRLWLPFAHPSGTQSDRVSFAFSETLEPTGPEGWSGALMTAPSVHRPIPLAFPALDGLPCVLCMVRVSTGPDFTVNYQVTLYKAQIPSPAGPEDWTPIPLLVLNFPIGEQRDGMAHWLDGRAAYFYPDTATQSFRVLRQIGEDPTDPASWRSFPMGGGSGSGFRAAAIEFDGGFAVAHINRDTGQLRISYSDQVF